MRLNTMDTLPILKSFNFDWLDKEWVNSIWDSDFLLYSEPPSEYHAFAKNQNIGVLLKRSRDDTRTWLAEGKKEGTDWNADISWQILIEKGVNVRNFLAILGYVMKTGQQGEADDHSRLHCLRATSLYFMLLAVPGSNAFNIFSPNLYKRALETLKLIDYIMPSVERKKSVNTESFYGINHEDASPLHLSSSWQDSLKEELMNIVLTFNEMIESFWFKDYIQSLDLTIHTLLEVAQHVADSNFFNCDNRKKGSLTMTLSHDLYTALESLCDSRHCSTNMTIMLIAKHILPCLSFAGSNTQVKLSTNFCETFVTFLGQLSHSYEVDTNAAILTLIQHLMRECPERLETRQKQAVVIMKLLQICNESTVTSVIENLILLSHNTKVACRVFAQEIISRLLNEPLSTNKDIREDLKHKVNKILIATALSRCVDRSSMVRSKAMSILADYTEANDNINKICETSRVDSDLPTIDCLKRALSDSSDPLPSMQTTIKILIDRVEDERAQVRRNALQILKNVALARPELLSKITAKIGDRCRDPALSVRRFAVQVLTTLLERYSDNSDLLDEWIRTVVPQIFDVEVKVQEKTLESLQDVLLNRITRASYASSKPREDDPGAELPWRVLRRLTSMKMRKHLSKACNLWVKNGTITKSVVANVQSHIDTKNDILAWVLLVAISESQKLQNIHKYVANYKELIRRNDFHACLVLEVLRSSWSSLDKSALEDLYLYVYNSLCLFDIDYGLVSVCMDILAGVTRHLDPARGTKTVESNAAKFMDLAETEMQKFLESEDDATDVVRPIFLKAMSTLGHAALLCPGKTIRPSTLRVLEGLILEHESLPSSLRRVEGLRACAVVLLSQLATRDREVAQEVIPIFGRLVREPVVTPTAVAAKVNASKALADLCVRHTALVEPYLSDMCVSMRDPDPVLREVILVIFIQLLLEDYIKANRPFFFHILTMLADEDKTIRELTVFLIEERLLAKNKTLVTQRFLEGIYHYNDYGHARELCERKMRERERRVLTLPGKSNERKRRVIYDFMLEHMDPPGKLRVIVKLTGQILAGVCAGTINVDGPEGRNVLKDALYVVGNPRLRPSHPLERNGEEDEECPPEQPAVTNAVNVIVESAKKHGLEVLLPVLTKLWKKFVAENSPLQKDVRVLLLRMLADYERNQLADLFMEYPELEKEASDARRSKKDAICEDDESSEETSPPTTPIVSQDSLSPLQSDVLERTPRVVLRRLSFRECREMSRGNVVIGASTRSSSSPDGNGLVASTPKSRASVDQSGRSPSRRATPRPRNSPAATSSPRMSPTYELKRRAARKNLTRLESESDCD